MKLSSYLSILYLLLILGISLSSSATALDASSFPHIRNIANGLQVAFPGSLDSPEVVTDKLDLRNISDVSNDISCILGYFQGTVPAGRVCHSQEGNDNTAGLQRGAEKSDGASAFTADHEIPSLWINKTADGVIYASGQNVTYTIKFGNTGTGTAIGVTITDILPEVEVLYMDTPPTFMDNDFITWDIGRLGPGQNGSITLVTRLPDIQDLTFQESSNVSGDGFVNLRKSLSATIRERYINNTANISGLYEFKPGIHSNASSLATIQIDYGIRTEIKSSEHGSGHYEGVQNSGLHKARAVVRLNKDIFAEYKPATIDLPNNRTLEYSSLWSDRTSTSNDMKNESLFERYLYMDLLDKESSFGLGIGETAYSSRGNFSGGEAQIGYTRQELESKTDATYIRESYHGSFHIEEYISSYGDSPTYKKYASGSGFASSDKRITCDRRSYEYGSGIYESSEVAKANTIHKNSTLIYKSNNQSAGTFRIGYAGKWNEGMYTRDPTKGLEISNRISSADYIQKEALMSSSYLSMTGSFNGTESLKARAFMGSDEVARVDQVLTGGFRLDATISLSRLPKYLYPHINVTKKVESLDGNTVLYRINVTNDGNKTLEPVVVVDLLPEGASFVSSTLKPSVQGRVVSWTLLALPVGETQTIDLKAHLGYISSEVVNRVQVIGRYQGRAVTAESAVPPYEADSIQNAENESLDAFATGDWRPPSCIGLESNITSCEPEIDLYYDNIEECRFGCP